MFPVYKSTFREMYQNVRWSLPDLTSQSNAPAAYITPSLCCIASPRPFLLFSLAAALVLAADMSAMVLSPKELGTAPGGF